MRVARAVFHETFLNIGGDAGVRDAGIVAGRELAAWIHDEIARRRTAGRPGSDVLGCLMTLQPTARLRGERELDACRAAGRSDRHNGNGGGQYRRRDDR